MLRLCSRAKPARLTNFTRYQFTVRVRYAPSPTGFMHIGGLRTALFNYLFAKKHAGAFIVRIQDTDKNREVEGSLENIFETLKWVGIVPDQSIVNGGEYGPYIQSERLQIYKNIEKNLLKSGKAYPCFCREEQKQESEKEGQPCEGTCRSLTLDQIKAKIKDNQPYAVRVKADFLPMPPTFLDQVFGELQFKPLDDFIIVRRNGWPTFHLANVVDDWQMKITHVMRGEEWLTNTNKHIYLYYLLGAPVPKFVHLPLIKGMDGKKLAKRDPASSVKLMQEQQYEVLAVRSMLATMGLNNPPEKSQKQAQGEPEKEQKGAAKGKGEPEKEQKGAAKGKDKKHKQGKQKPEKIQQKDALRLLTDAQMLAEFDISKISRSPVKFDKKQLEYLNRLALKSRWRKTTEFPQEREYFIEKLQSLVPSSKEHGREYCEMMVGAVVERLQFISDLGQFGYYFQEPNYFDQQAQQDLKKIYGKEARLTSINEGGQAMFKVENSYPELHLKNKKIVHNLRIIVEHVIEPTAFSQIELAKKISQFLLQSPELHNEDVFHLLRFMVTARKSGPNITQACGVIGRDRIARRMAAFSSA